MLCYPLKKYFLKKKSYGNDRKSSRLEAGWSGIWFTLVGKISMNESKRQYTIKFLHGPWQDKNLSKGKRKLYTSRMWEEMFLKHAILIIFILLIIVIAVCCESSNPARFSYKNKKTSNKNLWGLVLCLNIYFTGSLSYVFSQIQLVSGIFYLFGLPFLFWQG